MTKTHILRDKSVLVHGLVFDINYYWTPGSEPNNGFPGDDPNVEINSIRWQNSAGEDQDITDLILGLDRIEQGKVSKLHSNSAKLTWQSIMSSIIESIEQLELNQ